MQANFVETEHYNCSYLLYKLAKSPKVWPMGQHKHNFIYDFLNEKFQAHYNVKYLQASAIA